MTYYPLMKTMIASRFKLEMGSQLKAISIHSYCVSNTQISSGAAVRWKFSFAQDISAVDAKMGVQYSAAFESRSPKPLFTFTGIVTAREVFMCVFCIISLKLEVAHLAHAGSELRFYSPVMTAIRIGPRTVFTYFIY